MPKPVLLPPDLEAVFTDNKHDPETLITAFMPIFCKHVQADRIFVQPRNPQTRVCKVLRWRRDESIPCIYIEDLEKSAKEGILNLDFESRYMFHTAFIHGHAHSPPLPPTGEPDEGGKERQFYGSVQPAVFGGPRVWSEEVRELVGRCLVRIAPVMKEVGEKAPPREHFGERS